MKDLSLHAIDVLKAHDTWKAKGECARESLRLICCEVGRIRRLQDKCVARQDYLHQITYTRATRDPKDVVSYSGAEGTSNTPETKNRSKNRTQTKKQVWKML